MVRVRVTVASNDCTAAVDGANGSIEKPSANAPFHSHRCEMPSLQVHLSMFVLLFFGWVLVELDGAFAALANADLA